MSEEEDFSEDSFLQISKEEFVAALKHPGVLKAGDKDFLRVFAHAGNCAATPTELCRLLGKKHFIEINGQFGRLGKRIAQYLKIDDGSYEYWNVLAFGKRDEAGFVWYLKGEFIEALAELGVINSPDDLLAEEVPWQADLYEGAVSQIHVNKYERNPLAKTLCIQHYGLTCSVCSLDFAKKYGALGIDFIHVHHLVELSTIGHSYKVDPVKDLRPVCPNCHAMLHRKTPALSIQELREILIQRNELESEFLGLSDLAGRSADDPTLREICEEAYRLRDADRDRLLHEDEARLQGVSDQAGAFADDPTLGDICDEIYRLRDADRDSLSAGGATGY
jgi:predicted HNH restriction endonuclease